jgi:hypothetical protein
MANIISADALERRATQVIEEIDNFDDLGEACSSVLGVKYTYNGDGTYSWEDEV